MAKVAFTASSDVLDDGHYVATVTQTGLDTASLFVQKWTLGADYTAPPASQDNYALINIRTNGNKLTGYIAGEPMGITPHWELDIAPPVNLPSMVLNITNALMWDQRLVLPISAADDAAGLKFVAAANFPLGTAT
jgi:hypothetical protein